MEEQFNRESKAKRHRTPKYRVVLSLEERNELSALMEHGKNYGERTRAKILRLLDEGPFAPEQRTHYWEIAAACNVSERTVFRVAKEYSLSDCYQVVLNRQHVKKIGEIEEKKLSELLNAGGNGSVATVAEEIGCTKAAIYKTLQKLRTSSPNDGPAPN